MKALKIMSALAVMAAMNSANACYKDNYRTQSKISDGLFSYNKVMGKGSGKPSDLVREASLQGTSAKR